MVARAALMKQRMGGGAKRGAVARYGSIPAPTGGLNARDSIAAMKATDALQLDNWVPGTSNVSLRLGYRKYATGLPGDVQSLLPYRSPTGNMMFGVAGSSIYDVTALGPVGTAVVSGLANSQLEAVNFGTPGGHFLLAVNGADPMRRFSGTAWDDATDSTVAPAITGFDTSLARNINVYGERVWLVEKNSFRVWYLGLQSIGGAASELDLSSLFKLGGSMAGMMTYTVAGTTEENQYAVFISTEGEVIIFTGDDPTNAETWARSGQGRIGRPVGNRFWERVGTDAVLINADGFVPLSQALEVDRDYQSDAVSNKIITAANQAVAEYSSYFGWQVKLFPSGNKLIVNVPTTDGVAFQFVMNTITGAWCRYIGIDASCWEATQDNLFFGGNGIVYQAEYGNDDDGSAITAVMIPAFNYFGNQTLNKRFTQVRVIVEAGAAFSPTIDLLTNFDQLSQPSQAPLVIGTVGSLWNTSPWNSTSWGAATRMGYAWQWAGGIGFAATSRIQSVTKGVAIAIDAIGYAFELGGAY